MTRNYKTNINELVRKGRVKKIKTSNYENSIKSIFRKYCKRCYTSWDATYAHKKKGT